jgi:hypothetical protein
LAELETATDSLAGIAKAMSSVLSEGTTAIRGLEDATDRNLGATSSRLGELKGVATASNWAFLKHIMVVLVAIVVFCVMYVVIRVFPRGTIW